MTTGEGVPAKAAERSKNSMNNDKNLGGWEMHEESTELELRQRLAEEITILRIEGSLFCFDPREARRRVPLRWPIGGSFRASPPRGGDGARPR